MKLREINKIDSASGTSGIFVFKILDNGSLDTLATFSDGFDPRLAYTGPELFAKTFDSSATGDIRLRPTIYNVQTNAIEYPFNGQRSIRSFERVSPDSPMYFIPYDSMKPMNVWRLYQDGSTTQITSYQEGWINDWYVKGDTLLCEVGQSEFTSDRVDRWPLNEKPLEN